MNLFESLKNKVKGQGKVVVFPEGEDIRIQSAAERLVADDLAKVILLGNTEIIQKNATNNKIDLSHLTVIDPNQYPVEEKADMVEKLFERRNGKNTKEQVEKMLQDVNYFGTMLVYLGKADAMVSGAVHSTGDTVRPVLQIIKTKPGMNRISGSFILQKGEERFVFGDSAINIDPDADTLAEIAIQSAQTARLFDIDPKVAMLSFSTNGSAAGPMVDKVREATKIAQEREPETLIEGELQFDAAMVPEVAKAKYPESKIAGQANVFIFPELQSGNIGYKIAQRLGGFEAIGPILQGLNAPVSDLSRGANAEDVYNVAITTILQAL